MKIRTFAVLAFTLGVLSSLDPSASAKDKPVQLQECPPAVQAVIKQYTTQGTVEEIGFDEKKKSGGPAVYEAKIKLNDGRRVELHITASGQLLTIEEKKPKS